MCDLVISSNREAQNLGAVPRCRLHGEPYIKARSFVAGHQLPQFTAVEQFSIGFSFLTGIRRMAGLPEREVLFVPSRPGMQDPLGQSGGLVAAAQGSARKRMPAGAMERSRLVWCPESVSNEHARSVCLGLPSEGGFRL
jgi:hypothetical protein